MTRADETRFDHALHYDAVPPYVCLGCDLVREVMELRLDIKRLESTNYRLKNRCIELEADNAVACETPDPKCDCPGCSLVRELNEPDK